MWANFFLSHQVVVMSHRNVALEPLHLYFHRLDDWYPSLGNHILSRRSDQHLIYYYIDRAKNHVRRKNTVAFTVAQRGKIVSD
jgi:hypothetical protein